MKCWKCGREIVEGTSVCPYCGAAMRRPEPITETGRAMRMLYDRYGAQEVLTNGAYLVNGLADLTDGNKALRNQLRMAMDAGLGKAYLAQLQAGAPDAAFAGRVKLILTEDAGLSDKAAGTLAGYFDEMIGWRSAPAPERPPRKEPEPEVRKAPGWNEVDRTGRYTTPVPRPQPQRSAPPALEFRNFCTMKITGPLETIKIYFRSDTHQIERLEYVTIYETHLEATMRRVRDELEAVGNALHFGTVDVTTKSGTVSYIQKLDITDLPRAEAQGFVTFVHMDRWKKPKAFQIKFSRTLDVFADHLEQAGFTQVGPSRPVSG